MVIDCDTVQAHPCGEINIHTVLLTEKYVREIGNAFRWEAMQAVEWLGNYTAIGTVSA